MHELLNVLYVMTQGTVLHLDHDTVRIEVERETKLRVPLLRLSGIVAFGQVTITPFLIQRCAEDGRSLIWLDRNGRFKAPVERKDARECAAEEGSAPGLVGCGATLAHQQTDRSGQDTEQPAGAAASGPRKHCGGRIRGAVRGGGAAGESAGATA